MQQRTPAPAASRDPAALLAVFALAPDPAVGAHVFAAAVEAEAIISCILGCEFSGLFSTFVHPLNLISAREHA